MYMLVQVDYNYNNNYYYCYYYRYLSQSTHRQQLYKNTRKLCYCDKQTTKLSDVTTYMLHVTTGTVLYCTQFTSL